jgi:hypothetical protein
LKISDLVFPIDPERPLLHECKLSERPGPFAFQGRRGRQLSRMKGTSEYLTTGRAKLQGEVQTRVAIEIAVKPEYNWSVVNDVCSTALKTTIGSVVLSDGELIYATTQTKELPEIGTFRPSHAVVGRHLTPIEEASCRVPPPLNWDLPSAIRIALQEGDLFLYHIFNPWSLVGYRNDVGAIVGIQQVSAADGGHGYRIRIDDEEVVTSSNFTDCLLYGYEKANSIADRMIAFCAEIRKTIPPEVRGTLADFE